MIKKIILVLLIAVFFVVIYRNIFNIKIVEIGNIKVIDSDEKLFFVFEDFFHKELKGFRKRENLDSEARNLKSEFNTIVALRNWTNKQWEQGNPNPYPPFNANVILELIRSKGTGGWCGQYGAVFAQACMSFGIPARYMEIMPEGSGGHFLVEVYSRDYKKWVLMDPTLNVHYEKDGIPLSVVELHNYKNHLKSDNVYQVSGSSRSIADLNYFYSFDCWLRNNHLSVPLKIIVKGNIMYLVAQRLWYNCECVSDLKRKEISPTVEFISSDIRHFYWEPDILAVKVLRKSVFGRGIELEFSGVLNGYQEYLVSCDGKKTWQRSGQKYFWRLKRGINILEVTAPDMNGLDLRCSYIIAELGS